MVFRSRTNLPERSFSPSSTGFAPVYSERIGKDGVLELVLSGKHNIVDFVQASLESTKIYNILERYSLGDTSVLEKTKGFFGDVSQMPTSLLEAHKFIKGISEKFDSLPNDLKAKFDNSVDNFVKSLDNGSLINVLKEISDSKVPKAPIVDKEDENV